MKVLAAEFVTSAAGAAGLPRDPLPHVAFIGRSNVGKSSLINALVKTRLARTSAAPGKTRLINLFRIRLGGGSTVPPAFYLVDLPGYGYARGGGDSAREFETLTEEYFRQAAHSGPARQEGTAILRDSPLKIGALLLVDSRHPGLPRDIAAIEWMRGLGIPFGVVATKIDQLSRAERNRSLGELETIVKGPVLPVSAVTGEGLEELWKQIVRLCSVPGATSTQPSSSSRP